MSSCIFCKIINKEIPSHIVYETEDVFCFLDAKPLNPGHTLIVPKQHFETLFDLDNSTLLKVASATKKVATAIKDTLKADGINIGQNNGRAAGQVVFHYHTHIIPRFTNDGYTPWKRHEGDTRDEQMKVVADNINKTILT